MPHPSLRANPDVPTRTLPEAGAMRTVPQVLLVVGGLAPLAAMLAALFAAVWIREGRREREAVAPRSRFEPR